MTTLRDLLNSTKGLHFLQERGVFTNLAQFETQLQAPVSNKLLTYLGVRRVKPVYTHQQLYLDYRRSVLSKLRWLQQCGQQSAEILPFFLWIDTDRSGADKLSARLYWPMRGKQYAVKVTPPGTKDIESRFVRLRPQELEAGIHKLGAYVQQSVKYPKRARPRFEQLSQVFMSGGGQTLSAFNHRLTYLLFNTHLGLDPYSVILSEVANCDVLTAEIDLFINQIDDVIRVFNETIDQLRRRDIEVPVKPLPEDYLPLHISCETDQKRIRLRHIIKGKDHFAVGRGDPQRYCFYLGSNSLSIAEITQTHRWSPDVCMPMFFNDLVSGFVAGKSSALYSLVMNEVSRRIFQKVPVPILVPQTLADGQQSDNGVNSLLYDYLNA